MQAILVADYSFTPLEYWRGVSLTAREFIRRCLTVDPAARMTAHEALSHPWITELGKASDGEEDLLPTVKKNFNARRTLHAAIDTIRAINQLRAGPGRMAYDLLNHGEALRMPTSLNRQRNPTILWRLTAGGMAMDRLKR
jgi:calcium/calmodulin-dependent protein kinase I